VIKGKNALYFQVSTGKIVSIREINVVLHASLS